MKKLLMLLVIGLLLTGCGTFGPIENRYPPGYTSQTPSTVVIERHNQFKAGGMSAQASVNGIAIYGLKRGEQIVFKVDPGENYFGVVGINPWTYSHAHHEIKIDCLPGETYYLLIETHLNIAPTIQQVRRLVIKRDSAN